MLGSDLESSFVAMLVICGLIGAATMALLIWLVPLVWEMVKPWLHAITG